MTYLIAVVLFAFASSAQAKWDALFGPQASVDLPGAVADLGCAGSSALVAIYGDALRPSRILSVSPGGALAEMYRDASVRATAVGAGHAWLGTPKHGLFALSALGGDAVATSPGCDARSIAQAEDGAIVVGCMNNAGLAQELAFALRGSDKRTLVRTGACSPSSPTGYYVSAVATRGDRVYWYDTLCQMTRGMRDESDVAVVAGTGRPGAPGDYVGRDAATVAMQCFDLAIDGDDLLCAARDLGDLVRISLPTRRIAAQEPLPVSQPRFPRYARCAGVEYFADGTALFVRGVPPAATPTPSAIATASVTPATRACDLARALVEEVCR
jgi:hypothetical protein